MKQVDEMGSEIRMLEVLNREYQLDIADFAK